MPRSSPVLSAPCRSIFLKLAAISPACNLIGWRQRDWGIFCGDSSPRCSLLLVLAGVRQSIPEGYASARRFFAKKAKALTAKTQRAQREEYEILRALCVFAVWFLGCDLSATHSE